ncbi:predicted protein [Naegleria gruberi]|uniref:Poly [ADP-ribose] polymerase n=1 Tax=Naegleria gruberi TaxID=5762 RepID=D2V174_NAEGR|nr:uncharacterized protein NAEGRDRAFT_62784 [Naegleria gruberi]EFC49420.1 predicted protein [Naegleria gruberi]|eukprot:XP_002682164.1 predicted protein [Naegleria gruberi strain NEG-M]
MKQNNPTLPTPSVSSQPPQNIPQGTVPQIVGYMTTGANPQFLPVNYVKPQQSTIQSTSTTPTTSHSSSPSCSKTTKSSTSTKVNELKDKVPCKHWDKCTKTNYRDHVDHGEKYYHPCKKGANCSMITDSVHRSRFVHPCKYDSKCTKLQQKEHCLHYFHTCQDATSCQKYLSGDISHCYSFIHESKATNSTSNTQVNCISSWPKEWENPPKLSKNPLMKPHFRIVTLSTSSKEFQHCSQLFSSTSTGKTILKIERIENYIRWNWYSLQKQNMKANHNEKQLFHGTQQQFADLIAKEGFDARVSNSGKFGNGIYFSPNASYSLGYAGNSNNGRMFIVRVLVGHSYDANMNMMQTIKIAPQGFDSVTGWGGQEIIVYDNKQAYPEYLITYQ